MFEILKPNQTLDQQETLSH